METLEDTNGKSTEGIVGVDVDTSVVESEGSLTPEQLSALRAKEEEAARAHIEKIRSACNTGKRELMRGFGDLR